VCYVLSLISLLDRDETDQNAARWLGSIDERAGLKNDQNVYDWSAEIPGPQDSCYEGGVFKLEIKLPSDYPFRPPRVLLSHSLLSLCLSLSLSLAQLTQFLFAQLFLLNLQTWLSLHVSIIPT
jgi:hypothetical protein